MNRQTSKLVVPVSTATRTLLDLVESFTDGDISKPPFQRHDNVWPDTKKLSWIRSVWEGITSNLISPIVIYTERGANDVEQWLADGLQRLSTTAEFLNDPERFLKRLRLPSDISMLVVRKHLKNVHLAVLHATLASHDEGYLVFRYLNLGSAVDPFELHFGELALHPVAKLIVTPDDEGGIELAKRIAKACAEYQLPRPDKNGLYSRTIEHKLARDSYSLLASVLRGNRGLTDWWDVSRSTVNWSIICRNGDIASIDAPELPPELAIVRAIEESGMSRESLRNASLDLLSNVGRCLDDIERMVLAGAEDANLPKDGNRSLVGLTTLRTFLHWKLTATLKGKPSSDADNLIRKVVELALSGAEMPAVRPRIELLDREMSDPRLLFSYGRHIRPTRVLCREYGLKFYGQEASFRKARSEADDPENA